MIRYNTFILTPGGPPLTQPSALFLAGDHWHDPQIAFDGICPILAAQGYLVDTITDFCALTAERLAGKSLLVLHRDGIEFPNGPDQPVPWMQPHQETAIEQFVLAGGSFLAFHNSGWGYPWKGAYRRTLGGYYIGHPAIETFHVAVVNCEHSITQGVASYDIEDEQHMLWFDYDRVTPLLVNQGSDGRQSIAGWAYPYGLGRVAFLANGHSPQAHAHPEFMKLKTNAIRWLTGDVR